MPLKWVNSKSIHRTDFCMESRGVDQIPINKVSMYAPKQIYLKNIIGILKYYNISNSIISPKKLCDFNVF